VKKQKDVLPMKEKIGFIGLGLIGGSIAKAIRTYAPEYEMVAYDTSKETLHLAVQEGIIDIATTSIDASFSDCRYVFLCAPVGWNTTYLKEIKQWISPSCILTDVGSVKGTIHEEVRRLGLEQQFIGGHPMAGAEKSGYEYSKTILIENAYYVMTPSKGVPKEKVEAYRTFLSRLKAIPIVMEEGQHDVVTGVISHLPHLLASTLVTFVKEQDGAEEYMKQLAAGGFKDLTRIASSSPIMWQQICLNNDRNLSEILNRFLKYLTDLKETVENRDEQKLIDFFEQAKHYRDGMPDHRSGVILQSYVIYCELQDEVGGIATIATILANHQINIKNIGIIHNREFEEGALRIEFYEDRARIQAISCLRERQYLIFER
jgi:prephenate dehydrogenase